MDRGQGWVKWEEEYLGTYVSIPISPPPRPWRPVQGSLPPHQAGGEHHKTTHRANTYIPCIAHAQQMLWGYVSCAHLYLCHQSRQRAALIGTVAPAMGSNFYRRTGCLPHDPRVESETLAPHRLGIENIVFAPVILQPVAPVLFFSGAGHGLYAAVSRQGCALARAASSICCG